MMFIATFRIKVDKSKKSEIKKLLKNGVINILKKSHFAESSSFVSRLIVMTSKYTVILVRKISECRLNQNWMNC